ncbi:MAG: hypothetical protein LBT39_07090, partial [Treponema sp.]|nr:hypothetical protein [Treponema sp.]
VLFGNNRFFAGFDGRSLVILRADTGEEIARDNSIPQGKLVSGGRLAGGAAGTSGGEELYCLLAEGIHRLQIGNTGRIERRDFRPAPENISAAAAVPSSAGSWAAGSLDAAAPVTVLGTAAGGLLAPANFRSAQSTLTPLTTRNQIHIQETALGKNTIAFLTSDKRLGSIPLDFLEIKNGSSIRMESAGEYNRISAGGSIADNAAESTTGSIAGSAAGSAATGHNTDRFLLWQMELPLPLPTLRYFGDVSSGNNLVLEGLGETRPSGNVRGTGSRSSTGRFPLRSVSVLGDRGLFLDTGGNVSVLSLENGRRLYVETVIGSMDAAFIDEDNILLGRSALASGISGGVTPFLMINTRTSETVSIPYPASVGARVYRGASGRIYGVTVEDSTGSARTAGRSNLQTAIIRLNIQDPEQSLRLVEYWGEDVRFSLAEADGFLASNLGGDGAAIYWGDARVDLERGPGLPALLADGDLYFIVLDAEGCISWHDPRTGEILAIFRLYENEWILTTAWTNPVWGKIE